MRAKEIFMIDLLTTCSSSVLEFSSGIVSGKTLSLGEETQEAWERKNIL